MRDFDDGKLPEAEAALTALIAQYESSSDPWTAGEIALCLQDRATVRRFSNRWQEALDDLSRCERIAMRLPLLPQRMTLSNVFYVRALVQATPYSDVYNPIEAANQLQSSVNIRDPHGSLTPSKLKSPSINTPGTKPQLFPSAP